MVVKELSYEVFAEVVFSREEMQTILDAAASHYDGYVKQQARGGGQARTDGFIYKAYCVVQNFPEQPLKLSFHELDTMAKALEIHPGASPLFGDVMAAMNRINAEVRRIRESGLTLKRPE